MGKTATTKDIVFLCQYFYPEYVSSATLPYDTAVALQARGYQVGALVGYPKDYSLSSAVPLRETVAGIEIRRIKYAQAQRSSIVGRLINYLSFTVSAAMHIRYLGQFRAIVVYSNPPVLPLVAAAANKIFKTKVIFVSYDVYPEIACRTGTLTESSAIVRGLQLVNRMFFKQLSKVVALSSEMKEYLVSNRSIAPDQVEVIPNWHEDEGVPDKAQSGENSLFRHLGVGNRMIVSYFGNLGICQDLSTMLSAADILRHDHDINFVFAGHGNKMNELRIAVEQQGLTNISVFDFLHGQDYRDALSMSDCFMVSLERGLAGLAVPSKTYGYMMAGRPVIAIMDQDTDIARELLENEAGFSIRVGDGGALANALRTLRDDRDKRNRIGHNVRQLFLSKYTKSVCTARYVSLLGQVLAE